ncbi:DHHW family protein, partial [Ruminococcus sp.]
LPTSSSFYLPEEYSNLAYSEKDDFDKIEESLKGVIPVDAYNILNAHKDEAIYSRTDHHWQPLGAYYAAEQFALMAGVPFADLSEYETVTLPGYVGTLYMYTQSATLLNNPEDFVYYKPKTPVTVTQYDTHFKNPVAANLLLDPSPMPNSGYYMVFGSDERIVHVNTECKNGRNLVIFKDSYGNALLPMLTSSFENIYLCDIRYFDLNAIDFIDSVEATDVLFAMCSFSAVGANRSCIHNNLKK